MAKKLEELLGMHSIESQNRIFENAKIILNDLVKEDIQLLKLAEEAKNDETVKMSLKELRARVHKNRA
ncbi:MULTISPECIES: hypothetical protein [unclassified Acinetobacter]|jgi:hypothetical protein|uniref:hypothetical protein n=1 Tax=unclassified Acinetobacter TaxID=196816 RepID=UPI000A354740|nr:MULTISPECIES: hypothetical protein [unclassified Acinetobacter]OTG74671.1 hypothetical protein B9T38_00050 [Acinetobacter sp. ANC 4218]